MGERVFKKIQYGKELKTAKGTEVDATQIFLGDAAVPSDRAYAFPNYNLALRAKAISPHLYQQLVDSFHPEPRRCLFPGAAHVPEHAAQRRHHRDAGHHRAGRLPVDLLAFLDSHQCRTPSPSKWATTSSSTCSNTSWPRS